MLTVLRSGSSGRGFLRCLRAPWTLEGTDTLGEPLGPHPISRAGALRDPAAMPPVPGDCRAVMAMCPFLLPARDATALTMAGRLSRGAGSSEPGAFPENQCAGRKVRLWHEPSPYWTLGTQGVPSLHCSQPSLRLYIYIEHNHPSSCFLPSQAPFPPVGGHRFAQEVLSLFLLFFFKPAINSLSPEGRSAPRRRRELGSSVTRQRGTGKSRKMTRGEALAAAGLRDGWCKKRRVS